MFYKSLTNTVLNNLYFFLELSKKRLFYISAESKTSVGQKQREIKRHIFVSFSQTCNNYKIILTISGWTD